jgi:hypothetical protein
MVIKSTSIVTSTPSPMSYEALAQMRRLSSAAAAKRRQMIRQLNRTKAGTIPRQDDHENELNRT